MATAVEHCPLGLRKRLFARFTSIALHAFVSFTAFHHISWINFLIIYTRFIQTERANCCYLLFFHDEEVPLAFPPILPCTVKGATTLSPSHGKCSKDLGCFAQSVDYPYSSA